MGPIMDIPEISGPKVRDTVLSSNEIWTQVQSLKKNKSSGPSGIQGEDIQWWRSDWMKLFGTGTGGQMMQNRYMENDEARMTEMQKQ